jgi:hypothetical protein
MMMMMMNDDNEIWWQLLTYLCSYNDIFIATFPQWKFLEP